MTDQSSEDRFKASSFLQNHNAEYIEQLYTSVDAQPEATGTLAPEIAAGLHETMSEVIG